MSSSQRRGQLFWSFCLLWPPGRWQSREDRAALLHSISSHSTVPHAGTRAPWTDLHGQADGVEQDEDKHQVLKVGGVDHVPHFVLVLVLGDVPPQGPGLEGVLHALSLGGKWGERRFSHLDGVGVAEDCGMQMKLYTWG